MDTEYILGNLRQVALAEVDNANLSWFHVKACVVAGLGFFADAYDIFSINLASIMLGYLYGKCPNGGTMQSTVKSLEATQDLALKVSTSLGSVVGQVLFGWLGDIFGRRKMYGIELIIIILTTVAQAVVVLVEWQNADINTIIIVLATCRFIMGLGIGGGYPLSAIISSEFASTRIRGRMMTAVFAFQGWGNLASVIVALTLTRAFKTPIIDSINKNEDPARSFRVMWGLLIGLGVIPASIAFYFRLTIPETPRFTMDIQRNIVKASHDIKSVFKSSPYMPVDGQDLFTQHIDTPEASWKDLGDYFSQLRNFKVLFGAAYSWFALDTAFYGLNLNTPFILNGLSWFTNINYGDSNSCNGQTHGIYSQLMKYCVGNLVVSAAALVPGYWISFLLIDSWGRKPIQLMGFILLTILFFIMGFAFNSLFSGHVIVFAFLYCLANFFQTFGPNTTTFILPAELFPTRYRSTAYGICAASGKLGAIVAQVAVSLTQANFTPTMPGSATEPVKTVLQLIGFFMLSGVFSTLLLPETKGKSLEALSNENMDSLNWELMPLMPISRERV